MFLVPLHISLPSGKVEEEKGYMFEEKWASASFFLEMKVFYLLTLETWYVCVCTV